jgi:predicted alpha/beta hydrolase family esterase
VRYLSENPNIKAGKVVLVAPWLGILFDDEPFDETFFNFQIDSNLASRTNSLVIINSTNDHLQIHESVEQLRGKIDDMKYVELEKKGHFCFSDVGTEFPELLAEVLA